MKKLLLCLLCVLGVSVDIAEAQTGSIMGRVVDPIGAGVQATVTLLRNGQPVEETASDAQGRFVFDSVSAGRYQVEVGAAGFATARSAPVFVSASADVSLDIALQLAGIEQYVVVTAAATDLPQSRVGSPITVIDRETLDNLAKPDVLESLRTVPGMQVVQTGGRGGTTSVFVRGGAANFNKVLIDGIPTNDIGGSADFDSLSTAAIDRVEVLRSSNSVLYGSDALSGVINLTTPRGRTRIPELTYSIDGGNLGTTRNELSFGGAIDRFDYFIDVSRFDTDNDLPNNEFRNDTVAGRFGVQLGSTTDLSVTARRVKSDYGIPGAFLFNRIPDDSSQVTRLAYVSVSAASQWSDRWRSTLRFGSTDRDYRFVNPTPTGEPFDPFGFGANYLGEQVTITGANDFEVSGQAILDFGGSYPQTVESTTTRRLISGQADYRVSDALDVSAAVRLEHEEGTSGTATTTERTNVGSFVEARAGLGERVYLIGGLGFEHNEIFGYATTPRLSAAIYLRPPSVSSDTAFGDAKLTVNIGRGIKAPSVFHEQSSLFVLLSGLSNGDDLYPALRGGGDRSGAQPELRHRDRAGVVWRTRAHPRGVLRQRLQRPDRVPEQHAAAGAGRAAGGGGGHAVRRDRERRILPGPWSRDLGRRRAWRVRHRRRVVHLPRRGGDGVVLSGLSQSRLPRYPDRPVLAAGRCAALSPADTHRDPARDLRARAGAGDARRIFRRRDGRQHVSLRPLLRPLTAPAQRRPDRRL